MARTDRTLKRIATVAGYLLLGAVGTLLGSIGAVAALGPLRPAIYDALYLQVGPWTATTAATVGTFTVGGVIAIALPTLLGEYLSSRREHLQTLLAGLAGLLVALVGFLGVTAVTGAIGLLAAVVAFVTVIVAVPVGFRAIGVWSGGVTAFAGGVPVLVLLLLALGVGLGWGGGYYLTAEPVPAPAEDAPVADFDAVPEVWADLAGGDGYGYCESDGVCRLPLRGYEHEVRAARFLARHGVRCPYLNADRGRDPGSFIAEHEGSYYRVTCVAFGD